MLVSIPRLDFSSHVICPEEATKVARQEIAVALEGLVCAPNVGRRRVCDPDKEST